MAVGHYEEELAYGGKLMVALDSWKISYYFSGNDLRQKGDFVVIMGTDIDRYIDAYKRNWIEYEQLKLLIPKGGEFIKQGEMNMSIRVGGYWEGVCIMDHLMPVRAKDDLDNLLGSFDYAAKRAHSVQELLDALR